MIGRGAGPAGPRTRIRPMESVAAMLMVLFQLFFGGCGGEPADAPPPCSAADCEGSGR